LICIKDGGAGGAKMRAGTGIDTGMAAPSADREARCESWPSRDATRSMRKNWGSIPAVGREPDYFLPVVPRQPPLRRWHQRDDRAAHLSCLLLPRPDQLAPHPRRASRDDHLPARLRPFWRRSDPALLPMVAAPARMHRVSLARWRRKTLGVACIEAALIRLSHRHRKRPLRREGGG